MNTKQFYIATQTFFMAICLAISGCTNCCAATKIDASHCYPNYILDNGQELLGNNQYPAISYSGYRTTTRTAANCPSVEDIKEDMKILSAMGIKLIRTYNTQIFPQFSRTLQAIKELKQADPNFEMYVMLGAWIQCEGAYGQSPDHSQEDFQMNKREIDTAIQLANEYPDIVKIIAVGNEAMVTWQVHFVGASVILKWVKVLKDARATGNMPAKTLVTTSDNWAALGGQPQYHNDDLLELLKQIDFLSLHTYAFHDTYYDPALKWAVPSDQADFSVRKQAESAIQRAVEHQMNQYKAVKDFLSQNDIQKEIHIGETGWASLDNAHYGNDGTCTANEYNAKLFYDAFNQWTTNKNITCFYFEAFDEPWKSNGTEGSEGHFGLFTVDGKAKYPLWDKVDAGIFKQLQRGGHPITKTHNGNEVKILKELRPPVFRKHQ